MSIERFSDTSLKRLELGGKNILLPEDVQCILVERSANFFSPVLSHISLVSENLSSPSRLLVLDDKHTRKSLQRQVKALSIILLKQH